MEKNDNTIGSRLKDEMVAAVLASIASSISYPIALKFEARFGQIGFWVYELGTLIVGFLVINALIKAKSHQ